MICILVRDFAPVQEKRLNPGLPEQPLILIEAGKYRPKVIAPDETARHAGVKAGMWTGEARSLCPGAVYLPVDETRYQRIFLDITRDLLQVTDRIEPEYQATSAAWYSDDNAVLHYLQQAIHRATGILPQTGIARSKFPARVAAAATASGAVCDLPAGEEDLFLSSYPVSLLPLDRAMQRRLPLLGISTLGQLSMLPRIAVWEQFGKHGRWLHELARGQDIRPLTPFKSPEIISHKVSFDDPVVDRQILHRVLEQNGLSLIRDLQGREAQHVSQILTLRDGTVMEHHRYPPRPVRDHLYLLRLLTGILDSFQIKTAVEVVEVRLDDIRERMPVQLSLFDTNKPVMNLQQLAPEWATRHRQANFYHLHVNDFAVLPEDRIEHQRVSGA